MDFETEIAVEHYTESKERKTNGRCASTILFACDLCGKNYVSQSHFKEHVKREHDVTIDLKKATLKCPLCISCVKTYKELEYHLNVQHNVPTKHIKNTFKDIKEFQKWKTEIEQDAGSSYIKLNCRKNDSCKITKYICFRSGLYMPKLSGPMRKRKLKRICSNKMGSHCPSRIECIEGDNGVSTDYVPTHVGHDNDVDRLPLTQDERHKIAGKLMQGIPSERILQDINKFSDSSKRISLTTRQDIRNIKKAFNIESEIVLHSEDATSMERIEEEQEHTAICHQLQKEKFNVDLQTEKKRTLQQLRNLKAFVENSESLDFINYVSSNLQTILSGLTVLEKKDEEIIAKIPKPTSEGPSNKKIIAQKRILPAIKKENKKKKIEKIQNNNEANLLL